jgi:hypothetical protein
MDALRVRLDAARGPGTSSKAGAWKQAAEALRGASAILESARKESRTLGYNTPELAPSALQTVATDIASAWLHGANPASDVAGVFSGSLNRFLAQVSAAFVQSVEEVRRRLTATLEQAHAASGSRRGPPEELPKAVELPIMIPRRWRYGWRCGSLPCVRCWDGAYCGVLWNPKFPGSWRIRLPSSAISPASGWNGGTTRRSRNGVMLSTPVREFIAPCSTKASAQGLKT